MATEQPITRSELREELDSVRIEFREGLLQEREASRVAFREGLLEEREASRVAFREELRDTLRHYATKADLAEVRGEIKAMRWTMALIGLGLSILIIAIRLMEQ